MLEFRLTGPQGNSPLGFLTALGIVLTLDDAGHAPRLGWNGMSPHLVGSFEGLKGETEEQRRTLLINVLHGKLKRDPTENTAAVKRARKEMELAKTTIKKSANDIQGRSLSREEKREARRHELEPLKEEFSRKAALFKALLIQSAVDPTVALGKELKEPNAALMDHLTTACQQCRFIDRRWVDIAAAFGIPNPAHPNDRMLASPWALGSASGHQEFLGTIQELMVQCNATHFRQALFEPWDVRDEKYSLKYSLRLDIADDRRYALMSGDPTVGNNKPRTLWGANRLAFEALRFFPAMPIRGGMAVQAWRAVNSNWQENCRVRWPLWRQPIDVACVQSLLGIRDLWIEDPVAGERLNDMGVHAVMESRRIAVGQGSNRKYNLTPATPVWISSFCKKGAAV